MGAGKSEEPEEENSEKKEETVEAEVTLAGKRGDWESTLNVEDTLGDTTMDTTMEYVDQGESGAISCVAQRTRSHTEEMRERTAKTRKMNLSQLMDKYTEMKEEENKSQMNESHEMQQHGAVDSLTLPTYQKEAELKDL